jgi:hypothetical protein
VSPSAPAGHHLSLLAWPARVLARPAAARWSASRCTLSLSLSLSLSLYEVKKKVPFVSCSQPPPAESRRGLEASGTDTHACTCMTGQGLAGLAVASSHLGTTHRLVLRAVKRTKFYCSPTARFYSTSFSRCGRGKTCGAPRRAAHGAGPGRLVKPSGGGQGAKEMVGARGSRGAAQKEKLCRIGDLRSSVVLSKSPLFLPPLVPFVP